MRRQSHIACLNKLVFKFCNKPYYVICQTTSLLIVVPCSSLAAVYVMSLLQLQVNGATHTTAKLPPTAAAKHCGIFGAINTLITLNFSKFWKFSHTQDWQGSCPHGAYILEGLIRSNRGVQRKATDMKWPHAKAIPNLLKNSLLLDYR